MESLEQINMRRRVSQKISTRLVPLLFASYFFACLDRFNVGFAALQMNRDIGLSQAAFGFGAGVFFWGYVAFEVPSNLILARMGARLWLGRIMISWGIISVSFMFVQGAWSFYVLRLLLGVAEAGFLPGVIFYLTQWLPARERTATVATIGSALPVAGILGGPIAGALLSLDGLGNLEGWQWLFLVEGTPAIILGVVVLRILPERSEAGMWLNVEESDWLRRNVDDGKADGRQMMDLVAVTLRTRKFWFFGVVLFFLNMGTYGVVFWMPQILQAASGRSDFQIGLLAAVPQVSAGLWMIVGGRLSRYANERRWHVAFPSLVGGCAVMSLGVVTGLTPLLLAASMAYVCAASNGPFWALATSSEKGQVAAGGIALINACGAVAGFASPYAIGFMAETGNFTAVFMALGALLAFGGLLILTVRDEQAGKRVFTVGVE